MNAKEATLLELAPNGKPTDAIGVLGITGMTAYFGIIDVGQVKKRGFRRSLRRGWSDNPGSGLRDCQTKGG